MNHRRTLYKTVIERVLAHGAVAWCLEPTVRIARKSQQFNVRSSWRSQVPTGQSPRQLCRSYWVSLLFIYNYKEKFVAQHSSDLDILFLQMSVTSIPVKLKKKLPDDNQACINSAANPKSHDSIARKIFKLLHSHSHIRVSWIKAHAGYIGNEEADRLAKEAAETENVPETLLELPKPFIKTFLPQKMLATRQMAWDDGDTGRLIHNIITKVNLQPITGHATKFCFSQDMGLSLRFSRD
ncbi:hypothetical protein AVEN_146694-1 [Araneus ventricosus]|uniref:RNase H type-1 domain-containing protein n=1 Tax=Araneus ventricosus TaxID=182803 RepID=A0A4Y2SUH5_ARAVE|nr:hypothetical protein AVEN_146694-1 [Araneus ventricosus]